MPQFLLLILPLFFFFFFKISTFIFLIPKSSVLLLWLFYFFQPVLFLWAHMASSLRMLIMYSWTFLLLLLLFIYLHFISFVNHRSLNSEESLKCLRISNCLFMIQSETLKTFLRVLRMGMGLVNGRASRVRDSVVTISSFHWRTPKCLYPWVFFFFWKVTSL